MAKQSDPFKKYGGSEIKTEEDPFVKYGGSDLKKKESLANPSSGISTIGQTFQQGNLASTSSSENIQSASPSIQKLAIPKSEQAQGVIPIVKPQINIEQPVPSNIEQQAPIAQKLESPYPRYFAGRYEDEVAKMPNTPEKEIKELDMFGKEAYGLAAIGKLDAAEGLVKQGLLINPGDTYLNSLYANIKGKKAETPQERKEAILLLDKSNVADPSNYHNKLITGYLKAENNDTHGSIKEFNLITEQSPDNLYDESLDIYKKALGTKKKIYSLLGAEEEIKKIDKQEQRVLDLETQRSQKEYDESMANGFTDMLANMLIPGMAGGKMLGDAVSKIVDETLPESGGHIPFTDIEIKAPKTPLDKDLIPTLGRVGNAIIEGAMGAGGILPHGSAIFSGIELSKLGGAESEAIVGRLMAPARTVLKDVFGVEEPESELGKLGFTVLDLLTFAAMPKIIGEFNGEHGLSPEREAQFKRDFRAGEISQDLKVKLQKVADIKKRLEAKEELTPEEKKIFPTIFEGVTERSIKDTYDAIVGKPKKYTINGEKVSREQLLKNVDENIGNKDTPSYGIENDVVTQNEISTKLKGGQDATNQRLQPDNNQQEYIGAGEVGEKVAQTEYSDSSIGSKESAPEKGQEVIELPKGESFKDIKKEDIISAKTYFTKEPSIDSGYEDLTISERNDIVNKNKDKIVTEKVPSGEIIPTQEILDKRMVEMTGDKESPILIKKDGEYYILDGHHRIASDILNGKELIDAKVIDFDINKKVPEPAPEVAEYVEPVNQPAPEVAEYVEPVNQPTNEIVPKEVQGREEVIPSLEKKPPLPEGVVHITESKTSPKTIKKEGLTLRVFDKDGNEIPSHVKKNIRGKETMSLNSTYTDAIREYKQNYDYTKGDVTDIPKDLIESSNVDLIDKHVVDNTNNPLELVEIIDRRRQGQESLEGDAMEEAIAKNIGKVKGSSFNQFGDRNLVTNAMAKAYFNKEGNTIDVIAQRASGEFGTDEGGNVKNDAIVIPDDVVSFMKKYPYGLRQFESAKRFDPILNDARNKFIEVTGFSPSEVAMRTAMEQMQNKAAGKYINKYETDIETMTDADFDNFAKELPSLEDFKEYENLLKKEGETNGTRTEATTEKHQEANQGTPISTETKPSDKTETGGEDIPPTGTEPTGQVTNTPEQIAINKRARREELIASLGEKEGNAAADLIEATTKKYTLGEIKEQSKIKSDEPTFQHEVGARAADILNGETATEKDIANFGELTAMLCVNRKGKMNLAEKLIKNSPEHQQIMQDIADIDQLKQEIYTATQMAGSSFSKGMNALRILHDLDYSKEAIVSKIQAAMGKDAPPLSKERLINVDELVEKLEAASSERDAAIKKVEIDEFLDFLSKEKTKQEKKIKTKEEAKVAFKKVADAIRSGKISDDIYMGTIPFAKEIWNSSLEVAAKTIELTGDVTKGVKDAIDYLKNTDWYKGLDNETKTKAEEKIKSKIGDSKQVESKEGEMPEELLNEAIEQHPELTKEQIISAYNKFASKKTRSQTYREVGNEKNKVSKAKKEIQESISDLSPIEKAEFLKLRNLEKQLADLEAGKIKEEKVKTPDTEKVKQLKELIDKRKKELGLIPSKEAKAQKVTLPADVQAEVNKIKNLEKQLADLKNNKGKTKKQIAEDSDRATYVKEEIRQEKIKQGLISENNIATAYENVQYNERQIRQYEKRIADGLSRIERKDFRKDESKLYEQSPELVKKIAEYEIIKEEIDYGVEMEKLKDQHWMNEWGSRASDIIFEVPRGLMATADASMVLKQALLTTLNPRHIAITAKAFKNMGKYSFNMERATQWEKYMQTTPEYKLAKRAGMRFMDTTGKMAARDDYNKTRMLEKIPAIEFDANGKRITIPTPGSVIRASNRAYLAYANTMRLELFNKFNDAMVKDGKTMDNNPKIFKEYAQWANNITGTGSLGSAEGFSGALSKIFFATRLFTSRMKTIYKLADPRISGTVRKEMLKDWAGFASVMVPIYTGLFLMGANNKDSDLKIELNPKSSDWMKIRYKDNVLDPLGGYVQIIRTLAQVISGEKKNRKGKIEQLGTYGKDTRADVALNYFFNKLSPIVGFGMRWANAPYSSKGLTPEERADGEKYKNQFELKKEAAMLFIPMNIMTAIETFQREDPNAVDALFFGLGLFGAGTQLDTKKKSTGQRYSMPKSERSSIRTGSRDFKRESFRR